MIGYILLIVLMIAAIAMIIICDRHFWNTGAGLCSILTAILISLFMVSTIYVTTRKSSGEDFMMERDYTQELVNNITNDMSFTTVEKLVGKAKSINARIEDNREHADSKMWGFLYNKHIAEVEPIDIPVLEYKVFKIKDNEGN
jgi:glucan phosphoethanolaminetransferase (alkaline phosphatase superfamily)